MNGSPTLQGPLPCDELQARTHHVASPVAIDFEGVTKHSPLEALTSDAVYHRLITVPVESLTHSWYQVAPGTTPHSYVGVESETTPEGAICIGAANAPPTTNGSPTLQEPFPSEELHPRTHHVASPVAIDSEGVTKHAPLEAFTCDAVYQRLITVPVESFTHNWYHVAPDTTLHWYVGVESDTTPVGEIGVGEGNCAEALAAIRAVITTAKSGGTVADLGRRGPPRLDVN